MYLLIVASTYLYLSRVGKHFQIGSPILHLFHDPLGKQSSFFRLMLRNVLCYCQKTEGFFVNAFSKVTPSGKFAFLVIVFRDMYGNSCSSAEHCANSILFLRRSFWEVYYLPCCPNFEVLFTYIILRLVKNLLGINFP